MVREWRPPTPPLIASRGITHVFLNVEATGLKWFDGDKPGVDLEAMGCEVSDVGHYAALLDDHRQRSSLDALIQELLGEKPMDRLDESRMASYPAALVAPRACYNVQAVQRLHDLMWPQLEIEELHEVRKLEDSVIYVVCEMEKNGVKIDRRLLDQWEVQTRLQLVDLQKQLAELIGRPLSKDLFGNTVGELNPDSPKEMVELFTRLNLPITYTPGGRPSFSNIVLSRVEHRAIRLIERIGRLKDLRAKYIVGDQQRISAGDILRYALHQLRAVKDEMGGSEAGTVTGRFSSTEIVKGIGVNIQQRIKVAKQRVQWGFKDDDPSHDHEIYPVRQLTIPEEGEWLSADAMQIQYRLFAHEVDSDRINGIYHGEPKQNEKGDWISGPKTSFHKLTHEFFREALPDLPYRRMKDVNFAKLFTAGPKKIALMLGYITEQQFLELTEAKARNTHPLLNEVNKLLKIYDREIPEASALNRDAMRIAKERGFIRSILKRRARFPNAWNLHKAVNSRIQMSEADIMKTKLVELHAQRKWTGLKLRITVHDEIGGDARESHTAQRVDEILNTQSFPLRIPILWDVSTGPNWGAT
jgi:hypothetical protein